MVKDDNIENTIIKVILAVEQLTFHSAVSECFEARNTDIATRSIPHLAPDQVTMLTMNLLDTLIKTASKEAGSADGEERSILHHEVVDHPKTR